MAVKSVVISWIATLLALLAVVAVILLYTDAQLQLDTVRKAQEKLAAHPSLQPDAESYVTVAQVAELEKQGNETRKRVDSLGVKFSLDRMRQEKLTVLRQKAFAKQEEATARNSEDLLALGTMVTRLRENLEAIETLQRQAAGSEKILGKLRRQGEILAGLRVDMAQLKKKNAGQPPAGFSDAIKQLDPLQRESEAIKKRLAQMQDALAENKSSDTSALLDKRLAFLEAEVKTLAQKSAAVPTPTGQVDAVAQAQVRKDIEHAVALLEVQLKKEVLALRKERDAALAALAKKIPTATSIDPAAIEGIQTSIKRLREENQTLKAALTKSVRALGKRNAETNRTQKVLGTDVAALQQLTAEQKELLARSIGTLQALQLQEKNSEPLQAQFAQIEHDLEQISGQLQELESNTGRRLLYYYADDSGTYVVNPHKGWTAILDHTSLDKKNLTVHTLIRIPFSPAGKRISVDGLSADDAIGGFRGLNCEIDYLSKANVLPIERHMPEIYYYSDSSGTYIINPHPDTVAVLNQNGTTHFTGVPFTTKSQRISKKRLVAGGRENGFNCLNFRLVYFGHFSEIRFE